MCAVSMYVMCHISGPVASTETSRGVSTRASKHSNTRGITPDHGPCGNFVLVSNDSVCFALSSSSEYRLCPRRRGCGATRTIELVNMYVSHAVCVHYSFTSHHVHTLTRVYSCAEGVSACRCKTW